MKKTFTISLLVGLLQLSLFLSSAAQKSPDTADRLLFKGQVVAAADQAPVPFATVAITPIEGEQTKESLGQIADEKGMFAISLPIAADYEVVVTYVGMKSYQRHFSMVEAQKALPITIALEHETEELGTVTVAAAKPLVKLEVDRLAYSVQDDPAAKTEQLSEMLRKVPLVTVDGEGNVQVKGSSNFRIFLNGKPSNMMEQSPKEVLRSIPANTIKSIEVITKPGVKYDASGTGLILNIITESGRTLEGFAGSVNLSYSVPKWSLVPSVTLTTKVGKLGINARYNYYVRESAQNKNTSLVRTPDRTSYSSSSHNYLNDFHFGSLGISYDINPKNLLTASANVRLGHFKNPMEGDRIYWSKQDATMDDTPYLRYREKMVASGGYGSLDADLTYQHFTDREGEELSFLYQYSYAPADRLSELRVENVQSNPAVAGGNTIPDVRGLMQINQTKSAMHEHTAQIDWTRPFANIHSFELGAKYIYRVGNATPTYRWRKGADAEWTEGNFFNPSVSTKEDKMAYIQSVLGAYLSYSLHVGNFGLQSGIRAELSQYEVRYPLNAVANFKAKPNLDWVPQISLTYNLAPADQLGLSYNYRIQRPGINQLNPYRRQQSPTTLEQGNPYLDNARRHNAQIEYSHYSRVLNLNLSLGQSYTPNPINTEILYDKGVIVNSYKNSGRKLSTNLDGYIGYNPWAWCRLYSNISVSYNSTRLDLPDKKYKDFNGFGGFVSAGANVMLPKSWNIFFGGGYYKSEASLYDVKTYESGYHYLGIAKGFLKDRLSVQLYANNLFSPVNRSETLVIADNVRSEQKQADTRFSIGLRVGYRFGEMKSRIRRATKSIKNDDVLGGGQGQQGQGGQQGGQGQ